jgi:hypothetical protein
MNSYILDMKNISSTATEINHNCLQLVTFASTDLYVQLIHIYVYFVPGTLQNAFENINYSLIIKYKIFAFAFVMTVVPNSLRQYYLQPLLS